MLSIKTCCAKIKSIKLLLNKTLTDNKVICGRKQTDMKSFLFVLIGGTLLTLAACNNSSANNTANDPGAEATAATKHLEDSANYTTAVWTDSLQNFGTVVKGKQVKIVFHVKNT